MWFPWRKKKAADDNMEREISSMVDMLVRAYASVDSGPTFNVGDEFNARIKVTGTYDDMINFVIIGDEGHGFSSRDISRYRLAQIKESA